MACWVEDPNSEAYKLHLARVSDYIWVAEDGMKLQVITYYSSSNSFFFSIIEGEKHNNQFTL